MQHMELGTVGVWIDNTYTSFFIFNSFRDRGQCSRDDGHGIITLKIRPDGSRMLRTIPSGR